MKSIAIIGYGFVGKAIDFGFDDSINKILIDPILGTSIKKIPDNVDAIFVCLPTPMLNDGSQNLSIINKAFKDLESRFTDHLIILKSTVLPTNADALSKPFKRFVYNPEFLTEKNANTDFINASFTILGGDHKSCLQVQKIYENFSKCKNTEYIYTDIKSASFAKYAINTYLATKVTFFNELHALYNNLNCSEDWESFTKIIAKDERVGYSHMQVPGHDGKYGYGGACLPKDSRAMLYFSKKYNKLSLLETVEEINNRIRNKYEPSERETEQNISFKK